MERGKEKVVAVVPTCRGFTVPDQTIPVEWVIVHDVEYHDTNPTVADHVRHIVAPDSDLHGRRCDSIRSAGFLEALDLGARYILTVDDDCHIPIDWAERHVGQLSARVDTWWPTIQWYKARGTPYDPHFDEVAVTHGLWDGVPDLDARTQITNRSVRIRNEGKWRRIGIPFPQSAMNLGFRAEVAHCMYMPAQGEGSPFDRFADIWCGLLCQRVLSAHRYAFMNGGAVVHHERASNADVNLEKEAPGLECHETFWTHVWSFNDFGGNTVSSYLRLADHVERFKPPRGEWKEYFVRLARNMRIWVEKSTGSVSSSRFMRGARSSSVRSGA